MDYVIHRRRAAGQLLAAVQRRLRAADIASEFREPLNKVWAFLARHPGLRTDGHNVFLYRHGDQRRHDGLFWRAGNALL